MFLKNNKFVKVEIHHTIFENIKDRTWENVGSAMYIGSCLISFLRISILLSKIPLSILTWISWLPTKPKLTKYVLPKTLIFRVWNRIVLHYLWISFNSALKILITKLKVSVKTISWELKSTRCLRSFFCSIVLLFFNENKKYLWRWNQDQDIDLSVTFHYVIWLHSDQQTYEKHRRWYY